MLLIAAIPLLPPVGGDDVERDFTFFYVGITFTIPSSKFGMFRFIQGKQIDCAD